MRLRSITPGFALTLLAACGGGGGGSQVSLTTVSGTVVADAALAGYSVIVLTPTEPPSDGALLAIGKTGSDGRFTATSHLGPIRPFLIVAGGGSFALDEWKYRTLHSVSHRGGDVKVTPLTELLVARLLNHGLSQFDIAAVNELQNRPEADVSTARQQVVTYLLNRPGKADGFTTSPVDVSAVTDFASMPLNAVAGDVHFDALKRLHDSLMDSESIRGVEQHMLFGNDPPADLLAMLTLDFVANCTPHGINAPSGPTRIILDRHAITIGSVELAFQTGDKLRIQGNPLDDNYGWSFNSTTGQANAGFNIVAGRLTSFGVLSSTCVPQSEVSLSGKHPSVLALIRLLSQSIDLSREFQCAGPITYPGFLAAPDPNVLFFGENGAVRINGLSSPSLHLPSMAVFTVDAAPLVVTAGQVAPIRLTSLRASFDIAASPIDFDAFEVQLTDTGQITGLSLTNAHSQQAQHCGI